LLFFSPLNKRQDQYYLKQTDVFDRCTSFYLILPAALGPGVYSASNRNKYQKQKNDVSGGQSVAGA
jgi:hypothetical protein